MYPRCEQAKSTQSRRYGPNKSRRFLPHSGQAARLCLSHRLSPSSVGFPFSAAHSSRHCFRLIPASCSFAASAFPAPPLHHRVPSHKAAARLGSRSPRFWVPQKNGQKKETFSCPTYMLSGIGFRGSLADFHLIRTREVDRKSVV